MQDKTLGDYIKRVQDLQKIENPQPASNDDVYEVVPKPASPDSDEKQNPYSQH